MLQGLVSHVQSGLSVLRVWYRWTNFYRVYAQDIGSYYWITCNRNDVLYAEVEGLSKRYETCLCNSSLTSAGSDSLGWGSDCRKARMPS